MSELGVREAVYAAVAGIAAADDEEERDRDRVLAWITSGAGLFRRRKPDVPPQHLVSYFAVTDPGHERILLAEHINAGLLLPTGGHAEPDELPWETVARECPEELGISAAVSPVFGQSPVFVTATQTRDPFGLGGSHVDVSLWHVIQAPVDGFAAFDRSEFRNVHWHALDEIEEMPLSALDPAMHRFTRKFRATVREHQRLGGLARH